MKTEDIITKYLKTVNSATIYQISKETGLNYATTNNRVWRMKAEGKIDIREINDIQRKYIVKLKS